MKPKQDDIPPGSAKEAFDNIYKAIAENGISGIIAFAFLLSIGYYVCLLILIHLGIE